jgi:hypothetical protein
MARRFCRAGQTDDVGRLRILYAYAGGGNIAITTGGRFCSTSRRNHRPTTIPPGMTLCQGGANHLMFTGTTVVSRRRCAGRLGHRYNSQCRRFVVEMVKALRDIQVTTRETTARKPAWGRQQTAEKSASKGLVAADRINRDGKLSQAERRPAVHQAGGNHPSALAPCSTGSPESRILFALSAGSSPHNRLTMAAQPSAPYAYENAQARMPWHASYWSLVAVSEPQFQRPEAAGAKRPVMPNDDAANAFRRNRHSVFAGRIGRCCLRRRNQGG